jgi:hypothetical protein
MRLNFIQVLTLIFVVAKLTGGISWSWFWVFSPVIVSVAWMVLLIFIGMVIAFIDHMTS